jgi:hypothetical protein
VSKHLEDQNVEIPENFNEPVTLHNTNETKSLVKPNSTNTLVKQTRSGRKTQPPKYLQDYNL